MSKELSHIEFYFPEGEFADKAALVDAVVDMVEENESLDYCGHHNKKELRESVMSSSGDGSIAQYRSITEDEKGEIAEIITRTIKQCNDELPVPYKNFVFVYPFSPGEDALMFEGVMGLATYSCVFHLFINLSDFSKQALIDTVAHELNHTIYYAHHYKDFDSYTLLDTIVLEGLAENFKEAFFTPESTPWASALEEDEAFQILADSMDLLSTTDEEEKRSFIFGRGESQKRWMGYSVGYWLAKRFITENPELSWDEIMHTEPEEFLEVIE